MRMSRKLKLLRWVSNHIQTMIHKCQEERLLSAHRACVEDGCWDPEVRDVLTKIYGVDSPELQDIRILERLQSFKQRNKMIASPAIASDNHQKEGFTQKDDLQGLCVAGSCGRVAKASSRP